MHSALRFILEDGELSEEQDIPNSTKCINSKLKALVPHSDRVKEDVKITPDTGKSDRSIKPNRSISKSSHKKTDYQPPNYTFKPTINPNSQKILEKLNMIKSQHLAMPIEDRLIQKKRQLLLKPKDLAPDKNEVRGGSISKLYSSNADIENFYSKRILTRA
jgi:hypothetical protein